MKAVVIQEPGAGVRAWALVDRPRPQPGPGQVLLRVRAASLNYRDLMAARNLYGAPRPGVIALSDGVGEIVELGAGVTGRQLGERVTPAYYPAWHAGPIRPADDQTSLGIHGNDGLLAEYAVAAADAVVPVPSYLSDEAAATLPCAALTAWHALVETPGRVRPGATLLVQGTGGVALFAAQLGRAIGLRVVATSSSDAKLERLRALGVDEVINYVATPAWHERALALTGGEGVDQIIEVGGTGTLARSMQATRFGGTISVIGLLSDPGAAIDPLPVLFRALRLEGVRVGSTRMFAAMNEALLTLRLEPVIDAVYPLERAGEALAAMAAGRHFGKLVVRIGG